MRITRLLTLGIALSASAQAATTIVFWDFFGGGDGDSAPRERAQRSLGSGVLADASGLVVTNHHVIEGLTEVRVSLADRREFEAEIVLRDPRTDLAVLKAEVAGPCDYYHGGFCGFDGKMTRGR